MNNHGKEPLMKNHLKQYAVLAVGLFGSMLLPPASVADTHYVDLNSSSPTPPYTNGFASAATSIQNAVDASSAGDVVLVAPGMYMPDTTITIDKRITVMSSSTNWTETIINGDGSVQCFLVTTNATVGGFTITNGYALIGGGAAGLTSGAILTNCIITHSSTAIWTGGAVFCRDDSLITHCFFYNNWSDRGGGALMLYQGGTVQDTYFINNKATYGASGGAIFCYQGGTVSNCVIVGNSAGGNGGGVQCFEGGLVVDCPVILGNVAGTNGGGVMCEGGGQVVGCQISNNTATNNGGGVCSGLVQNCWIVQNTARNGGGISGGTNTNCTIDRNRAIEAGGGAYESAMIDCSVISNNAANEGGGLFGGNAKGCSISGNSASMGAGIRYASASNCTITANTGAYGGGASESGLTNCTITGNVATNFGGGLHVSTANGCAISGNKTAGYGGGAYWSTLDNCTILGNRAAYGGGIRDGTIRNSIIYYNSATASGNNHNFGIITYCCTTPDPGGPGNITEAPMMTSLIHLSGSSPCIAQGDYGSCSGVDIDGDTWHNPPCMGCDQYVSGSNTGTLSVAIWMSASNAFLSAPMQFRADIVGHATRSVWTFGDGTAAVTNQPYVDHTWSTPGTYAVTLWAQNGDFPLGVAATVTVQVARQAVYYVSADSWAPQAPYATWETAAQTIQDGINACTNAGDTVLVGDGVYQTGSTVAPGGFVLGNRIMATNPITIKSVNGPDYTFIRGEGPSGGSAVRCAYLANGAILTGFTLTNGFTRTSGDDGDMSGGGAYLVGGLLTNCVVAGNGANVYGGGVFGSSAVGCIIAGNTAHYGGGLSGGAATNCTITGNDAVLGGGTYRAIQHNCIILNNTAAYGGGVSEGTATWCTIKGNVVGLLGGGVCTGTLFNCIIDVNESYNDGAGAAYATLRNCTVVWNNGRNSTSVGSGVYKCDVNSSILCWNKTFVTWEQGKAVTKTDNYDSSSVINSSCTAPVPTYGAGNLNVEPAFADSYYHLSATSPCIDKGDPDPLRNDPEDPDNPGFALLPARGTLLNDMGAYGGHEHVGVVTPRFVTDGGLRQWGSSTFTVQVNCYPATAQTYPNVTLRYTLDGSEPTTSSTVVFGGAIQIQRSCTIKMRAFQPGWDSSAVASRAFELQPFPPVISPTSRVYTNTISVTATSATPHAVLYYTKNGTTPTNVPGQRFTPPISLNPNVDHEVNIRVMAYVDGWTPSYDSQSYLTNATLKKLGELLVSPFTGCTDNTVEPIPSGAPLPVAFVPGAGGYLCTEPGGAMRVVWSGPSAKSTNVYIITDEPVQPAVAVYHTEGASKAPAVDLSVVPYEVVIHPNSRIRSKYNVTNAQNVVESFNGDLWKQEDNKLHANNQVGHVVIHFEDAGRYIGVEVVELRQCVPDGNANAFIAQELGPVRWTGVTNRAAPHAYVSRGKKQSRDDNGYIYQHSDQGPCDGRAFAVKQNINSNNMEVFWMKNGTAVPEVAWPYELDRYTASWPDGQHYVRRSDTTEPMVNIPADLSPYLMPEERYLVPDQPDGRLAHGFLSGQEFHTDGQGYSLLMLATGPAQSRNQVEFQVVHSVWHTNGAPVLSPTNWVIGAEITNVCHAGTAGGYLYEPVGTRYHPASYGEKDQFGMTTGNVFAVNLGLLEVWWSNLTQTNMNGVGIQWPSRVIVYDNVWPTNAEQIAIGGGLGSGPILWPCTSWDLYYQNNSNLPGFNPNDEHALIQPANGGVGQAIFPLRCDLGSAGTSEPFVLMPYVDGEDGRKKLKVWEVVQGSFTNSGVAGTMIQPPYPLSLFQICNGTYGSAGPFWRDRKLTFWARAAGDDGGTASITMRYYYKVQDGFYFPVASPPAPGVEVPWLSGGVGGTPVGYTYTIAWPASVPELMLGETLTTAKRGLPDIWGQKSAEILYDQAFTNGNGHSVVLIDPVQARTVSLAQLPGDILTARKAEGITFPQLPSALRSRLIYDERSKNLIFKGQLVTPALAESYLLLNVISSRDWSNTLGSFGQDATWRTALFTLYLSSLGVTTVQPNTPFDHMALSAGLAKTGGYVTVAFNISTNLSMNQPADPISLEIIRVANTMYKGQIEMVGSDNVFDEQVVLRHSGDFAGAAGNYVFEWMRAPANDDGTAPASDSPTWIQYFPRPNGTGAVDVTISPLTDPPLITLSDNYFKMRYHSTDPSYACGTNWSEWTDVQLAEGWVKRVVRGINPFEQRIKDFQQNQVNTLVSMIAQAGARFEGSVPLNLEAADKAGLIGVYQTVLNRGAAMCINGTPPANYGPANDALLLAAGRVADLYMLLGNEAYADAGDPTIGFGTEDGTFGALATSLHCFMNQSGSLLDEELCLLRGRDDSLMPSIRQAPIYNRLVWNMTDDIVGGEVAYALNYGIKDVAGLNGDTSPDGLITEDDAKVLYPQGHGDAWGHYLSAIKGYYRLLQNTNFTWVPRIEQISLGGSPVSVDYLDERKFAKAAAAKARTGAEIVSLTFRERYTEDPDGQWHGYQDENTNRAWGVSEWASRAGQGAFFDWVMANAMLPPQPDNGNTNIMAGIRQIDRGTVLEIREIAACADSIQTEEDKADMGMNPLGLVKNVVPFDIDPTQIDQGQTHFEQIYGRAVQALQNTVTVFDHAQNASQGLRKQFDTVQDFQQGVRDREADFNNRLIEVYGYPYGDDIGTGKTYPAGYTGPDYLHFDYVDASALFGGTNATKSVTVTLNDLAVDDSGGLSEAATSVVFHVSMDGYGLVKPAYWTQDRRAPGQIQMARSDLLQAKARFERALRDYDNLLNQLEDQANMLAEQKQVNVREIAILNDTKGDQRQLNEFIASARARQMKSQLIGGLANALFSSIAEALPQSVGTACDVTSIGRSLIRLAGTVIAQAMQGAANEDALRELDHQQAKEIVSLESNIRVTVNRNDFAVLQQVKQLEQLVRQEANLRLDLYSQQEAFRQTAGRYYSALASAERIEADRLRFRKETAARIQDYRYKDMAFRIFRNDALQKYRAQFDLASTYVYLAARAYDYETNLREGDYRGPGDEFMTGIVKARAIGELNNGVPSIGSSGYDGGLADCMAKMNRDWTVLKSQLGFNNPQTETGRFSLRYELFRILPGSAGDDAWRKTLERGRVVDLLTMPEFQRYCLPFYPQRTKEPALVIPFSTCINFGYNFFGWQTCGGDNSYDSVNFATKIRSVGVWFGNYNNLVSSGLANTPRVYLIPVGSDVMRSPTDYTGKTREWTVLDQVLPVPFPLSSSDLASPAWIPINDSLSGMFSEIRRYGSLRAYQDGGSFNETETIKDSRLIGRSVWNTQWLLIIPAGTLYWDRNEGLNRFIYGTQSAGGTVADPNGVNRDGNGVKDIKIFFQTYSYGGM
ncbi:MAG: hypothetical protein C0404_03045 [Verrucomicrobia bacterium]|nr:hypothetical protein [Verrucomicrobiota bacterium]